MIRKILVCVKMVPVDDKVKIDTNHCMDRNRVFHQINMSDMAAVEVALMHKPKVSVTVLTMGTAAAIPLLKDLLARGVDEAVLLTDTKMAGSDTRATARILATAIKKLGPFDMILCGRKAIDGETGQVPGELAAELKIPCITNIEKIFFEGEECTCFRLLEKGNAVLKVKLPAIFSLCEYTYSLRLAGLKGIREASSKNVQVYSMEELGLTKAECGLSGSCTRVVKATHLETGLRNGVKETNISVGVEEMIAMIRENQT